MLKFIVLSLSLFYFICLYPNENCAQIEDRWEEVYIKTGDVPGCYSFFPKYNFKIDNFLRINVGKNTDIVVKMLDYATDECIRYVYISSDDTYEISNIPEGIYYLKIAFGNDWSKLDVGPFCYAKFLEDPLYSQGEDLLDFNLIKTEFGYEFRNYELRLEVLSSNRKNEYDSHEIDEEDFFK